MSELRFETERLILRPVEYNDANDIFEYGRDLNVGPSAGWKPHESIDETKEIIDMFIQKNSPTFAIVLKENNKMIGTCDLFRIESGYRGEIGYSLNPKYWNQGYTTEACFELVQYGFEVLELAKIEITCFTFNTPSKKVAMKLGFKYEGTLRKHYLREYDGEIFDTDVYGLTSEEYFESRKSNL